MSSNQSSLEAGAMLLWMEWASKRAKVGLCKSRDRKQRTGGREDDLEVAEITRVEEMQGARQGTLDSKGCKAVVIDSRTLPPIANQAMSDAHNCHTAPPSDAPATGVTDDRRTVPPSDRRHRRLQHSDAQ